MFVVVVAVAVDPPWRQTPLAKICQSASRCAPAALLHPSNHTHTQIHHSLTHSQRHRSAAAAATAEFEIRSTGLAGCSGGPEPVTRAYAVVFAYDLGCHHQEERRGEAKGGGWGSSGSNTTTIQLSYRRQRNMRSVPFRSLVVSFIAPQFVQCSFQFAVCSCCGGDALAHQHTQTHTHQN